MAKGKKVKEENTHDILMGVVEEMAKKDLLPKGPENIVQDCNFNAKINYDGDISQAVLEVAQGLNNLTELFMGQNIEMAMLKIGSSKTTKED